MIEREADMSNVETQKAVEVAAKPVTGSGTFTWKLELYERLGTCHIKWSATAPFRAQQGRLNLYQESFPANPNDKVVASVWDDSRDNPFDTKQHWGAGWCAAYVAELNGKAVYVCKTGVTED
jgi:hypothetical protein